MNELPKHLKYNPCPEIVRAHEQWQATFRQVTSQLQSMGHVRAPEAIANTVMPLFGHVDALFTLLQADLGAYAEQVMALSQDAAGGTQVIVGLHPQDAEILAELTDQIHENVEKVAKGLKDGTDQRKQLDEATKLLADLAEAIMNASLDEDEVPPEDEDLQLEPAPEVPEAPPPPAPADEDLTDEPLQII
jgi:hypothetical protein